MFETRCEWDEESVSNISDSSLGIKGPISRNVSSFLMPSHECAMKDFGLTNFTKYKEGT